MSRKCKGITLDGFRCKRAITSDVSYCYLHIKTIKRNKSIADAFQDAKVQAKDGYIYWPWASSFLDWLLPLLKKYKISYKNPNTGGDYSRTTILGSKPIELDWKHFDISDVDSFNNALRQHDFKVIIKEIDRGYFVDLKRI